MDYRNMELTLTRDCQAIQIPWGTEATLREGTPVRITQQLGGSFTVLAGGNLYRVEGSDADALGVEPVEGETQERIGDPNFTRETVLKAAWEQLGTCYDPEIPVDIVNLGLVYSCEAIELPNGRFRLEVDMTVTAPGCGMGMFIAEEARTKLLAIHGVDEAEVRLVWDPPWSREMMSEAARLQLGMMW